MTKPSSNLRARIISAAVLLPPVLFCLLAGGVFYALLLGLVAGTMVTEWQSLGSHAPESARRYWGLAGLLYISIPIASLFWLGLYAPQGMLHIFWLAVVIWSTDIFAYFAGKTWGKHKLAPSISPGKTWEGLAGGVTAAAIAGVVFAANYTADAPFLTALVISAVLAVVAQAGDLFESWIKRRLGVKDSGALIPGHGGIFDRVDGFMFAAPVTALLYAAGVLPLFGGSL